MHHKKFWLWLLYILTAIIFLSPFIYWSTGIGQTATSLSAEISRTPDGLLASSPKAEARHSLMMPMRIQRMFIYPLLLLAFQFSGGAIALQNKLQAGWAYKASEKLKRLIPQRWRKRLTIQDLVVIFLFIIAFNMAIFVLYLPFNFYRGFIVAHQFGLSTQTTAGWFSDWGKQVLISLLLEGILWTGFFAMMRLLPKRWPILGGALLFAFSAVFTLLTPVLITPLFYEVSVLDDSALEHRIITMAEEAGMPVDEIYIIDASSKTTTANAYFTGFGGAQRIVLYDTLLSNYTRDQVKVVLAHEMGHWYYQHTLLVLLGMGAIAWLGLFALRWLLNKSWQWLDLRGPADVAALPFIVAVITVVSLLAMPVENAISRYGERQADEFALAISEEPDAFIELFEEFAEQNLSMVDAPRWEKVIFYTHPPIVERLETAQRYQPN